MTTSQVETPQVNNELQEMIDREIVAASIDAYRRLGRANSRNAMPVEVVQGEATAKRSGSAFEKFLELAEAKVDFAVIQKKPNPLQGFAKFNPENGTVYELQGVAPNQTEVLKELTGFVVPVVPSLFISQHQIGAGGKILELPPPKLPDSYTDVAASSETLRPAQREAVRKLDAPMSFIWGPPGTGKTYTISQVILEIAKKGEKVIVTSTADKAVKGALGALAKLEEPLSCQFLEDSDPKADRHREYDRYIQLSRKESDRDQASLYKDKALSFLKTANAVFLNSLRLIANKDVLKENGAPTHIIIDEVSMMPVYMVSLIRNAFPRAKLILVGDPNQLSPVVVDSTVAKSPYGCNVYQLAGLNDPRLSEPENIVTFLDQTSRMPARLTQAISNKWYSGALKPTRSPGEFRPLCDGQPEVVFNFEGMPQGNLAFPESKNGAGKNSNATDAQTAVRLAKMAADAGREMMIISPYTGQVNLINHYLKANNLDSRVQATTVHKAQGAEADIVIWSVVANNLHFNKPGNQQADMIATVALSRAKQQVFIVGAKQGTVAYDFINCYEQLGGGAPQAPTPAPQVSTEVNNAPELTPDEECCNELGHLLIYLRDNPRDMDAIAIRGPHPAYACNKPEDFTPALAYAGIGARKTPDEVLQYMTQQATFLESMNCLLRTGDARGADEAFRNGAKYKSVYTPEQPILDWAREKVAEVCDNDYSTFRSITQNLLARNMYQLFGDGNTPDACYPSKFVLYWSEPSSEYNSSQQDNYFNCSSGTRYAVRAAVKAGIPTFNLYNQKELWEQYRDNGFEFPEVVKQVVELTAPDPKPEPERDMTKVLKDRAELLQYIMQRRNSKDKA